MRYYIPYLIGLVIALSGVHYSSIAQTEDTLVVEMLYKANSPQQDGEVYIDRATVFRYGEVELPSVPLERFTNIEYSIDDTFGDLRSRGRFVFDRAKLEEMDGKFPVNVILNGKEVKGFIKIPYKNSIRFNFYTDKIKPVLNFWINVEGVYQDGTILPMSADELILTTSYGEIQGLELILPEEPEEDEVTITACLVEDPSVCIEETLPIMQQDDRGYWEDEEEYQENIEPEEEGEDEKSGKSESSHIPGYERKSYYTPDDEEASEDIDPLLQDDEEEDAEEEKIEYTNKWDYLYKKIKGKKKKKD